MTLACIFQKTLGNDAQLLFIFKDLHFSFCPQVITFNFYCQLPAFINSNFYRRNINEYPSLWKRTIIPGSTQSLFQVNRRESAVKQ